MKNVQKHFQDFSAHSNLKDASTSSPFNSFPRFRKMQKWVLNQSYLEMGQSENFNNFVS